MPWSSTRNSDLQWLFGAVYFVALFVLFSLCFPEKKLSQIPVSDNSILNRIVLLPVYFVLNIIFIAALLIQLGLKEGTI